MQAVIELSGVLLGLALLAVCGAGLLWPWRGPVLVLAAPLAGLGALGAASAVAFSLGLRVELGLGLAVTGFGALTWCRGRPLLRQLVRRGVVLPVLAAAVLAVALGLVTNLWCGGPAIMLLDATDPVHYGIGADWLLTHPGGVPPPAGALDPYRRWAHFTLLEDGRPAVFALLAWASWLWREWGLFTYPRLGALALSAAVLGLVGVGARRRRDVPWLWAGGAVASWCTLAHTGFLGKLIAYPGFVLVVALALRRPARGATGVRMTALALLAAGFSAAHYGGALALLAVAVACGGWLRRGGWRGVGGLLVPVAVGVALAPLQRSGLGLPPDRAALLPALGDLFDVSGQFLVLPAAALVPLLAVAVAAQAALLAIAWRARDAVAMALLFAVVPVVAGGLLLQRGWAMTQCTGLFFATAVLGAVRLRRALGAGRAGRVALIALAALLAARLPRVVKTAHRFGAPGRAEHRLARRDLDRIVAAVRGRSVELRASDGYPWALVPMAVFGRLGLPLRADDATFPKIGFGPDRTPPADRPRCDLVLATVAMPAPAGGTELLRDHRYVLYELPTGR